MLIKNKRSYLMLVRLKIKKFRIIIPLSLVIFEDILESFYDLLFIIKRVSRGSKEKSHPADIIKLLYLLLNSLKSLGRWELLDMESKEVKIKVEFF